MAEVSSVWVSDSTDASVMVGSDLVDGGLSLQSFGSTRAAAVPIVVDWCVDESSSSLGAVLSSMMVPNSSIGSSLTDGESGRRCVFNPVISDSSSFPLSTDVDAVDSALMLDVTPGFYFDEPIACSWTVLSSHSTMMLPDSYLCP